MSKSVSKGKYFENAIKDKLERHRFYVTRSAGSKGVFDLVAIRKDITIGVQCKYNGYVPFNELKAIIELALELDIAAAIAYAKNRKHYICFVTEVPATILKEFNGKHGLYLHANANR